MGLFKRFAQLLAHGHDLAQVDLIEGRQHGDGVFGLHHAFGDALADTGHRHALFRTGATTGSDVFDQVFLGDAAGTASSFDIGWIDVIAGGVVGGARRQAGAVGFLRRCGNGSSCWRGFRHFGFGRSLRSGCGGYGAFFNDGDDLRAGDGGAGFELDFLQHAIDRRGHFQNHFVGFQINEVFIAAHTVADFFMPCRDDGV